MVASHARRRRAALVAVVLLVAGCSGDGGGIDVTIPDIDVTVPDVTVPDVELPDPEVPDVEAPPADLPASDEGGAGGGLSAWVWLLLIAGAVGVVALAVSVSSSANRRSDRKSQERFERQRELNEIIGSIRWLVDQGATSVLRSSDAPQAQGLMSGIRPQILDLEERIARFAGATGDDGPDAAFSQLGHDVAGLRSALESYVSILSDEQPDLVREARATANSRCRQVDITLRTITTAPR